jgi:SAM-dependent methyltransferase
VKAPPKEASSVPGRATLALLLREHHPTIAGYVTSERLATSYDDAYAGSPLFETDTRFLDEHLPPPPARVVDLGCGTGRHVLHLALRGHRVTGVDLSEHMLGITASKLAAANLAAELVHADICDLSRLEAGAFDAATCMFSTIGLMKDRSLRLRAMQEARRLLVPGGVFVFHVHNRLINLYSPEGRAWLVRNLIDAALGRASLGDRLMRSYRGEVDLFLHVFTRGEAERLCRDAGFRVVRTMPLNADRTGELTGPFSSLRANGFIIAAAKAD